MNDLDRDGGRDHAHRIGSSASMIALELGLAPERAELIGDAALLHDVGKLGVPDAIRLAPRPLSDDEFEIMKRHTTFGAELLAGTGARVLRLAEQVALCHHERWDGGGYPAGRSGTQTPLAARIVAVADAFDAVLHERPYKLAHTPHAARRAILRERGRHFDPGVVDAFARLDPQQVSLAGA